MAAGMCGRCAGVGAGGGGGAGDDSSGTVGHGGGTSGLGASGGTQTSGYSFGVGERLITSKSEPVFGGVYKLAAIRDKNGNFIPKKRYDTIIAEW